MSYNYLKNPSLMNVFYVATYLGRNIFEEKTKLKRWRERCPN